MMLDGMILHDFRYFDDGFAFRSLQNHGNPEGFERFRSARIVMYKRVGFHKWGYPKWMVYNGKSF